MYNPASVSQTPMGFCHKMDHLISARRPDIIITNKNKDNLQICELALPADHRLKLKEFFLKSST